MANQTHLKRINQRRILLAVRESGALSRSALADQLSLDRKSMTNLANELISSGWLCESGTVSSQRGRPGTLLELDREQHLFLGLHLSENAAHAVLINLHGQILGRNQHAFSLPAQLPQLRYALREVYLPLRRLASDKLQAIGLAVPGILDFSSGTMLRSVNLQALDGIDLASLLPPDLPADLYLEESSRAKALAELWFGIGQGRSSFVSIDLGIGIGSGIVTGKRLQGGAFAGEIGHVLIETGGNLCACGHRGCLEAYISERILCRQLGEALRQPLTSLEQIQSLNPEAEAILHQAGYSLGRGLAVLVNILCPPLLVLHGNLTRFQQQLFPGMEKGLDEAALPACRSRVQVRISAFGDEAAALGAAAAPLENVFLG